MPKPMTQEWVANHLDMWIGIYFGNKEDREKYTLGEWMAESLPYVCNTDVLNWLAGIEGDKK